MNKIGKCTNCGKEFKRLTGLELMCSECISKLPDTIPEERPFIKADNGKLQWSLLPFKQMEEVVRVLENGIKKYEFDNWKKCDDIKRYKDSLMRHVISYIEGEKVDDKAKGGDGLSHLAHAICNCLFLMYFDDLEKESVEKVDVKTPAGHCTTA